MLKIIIATSNPNKLAEINAINTNKNIVFDTINGEFNPVESGKTFHENASIKAIEAAKITKTYCLADDSGLCVFALENRPGIFSSRYAKTPEERIKKLLNEMKGIPFDDRKAYFCCSMVLVDAACNIIHTETGRVFGYIDDNPRGKNGFGYDPIFYLSEYNKTMAELEEVEKNKISHRANALIPMIKWIEANIVI